MRMCAYPWFCDPLRCMVSVEWKPIRRYYNFSIAQLSAVKSPAQWVAQSSQEKNESPSTWPFLFAMGLGA
jgi:hypothetical protein